MAIYQYTVSSTKNQKSPFWFPSVSVRVAGSAKLGPSYVAPRPISRISSPFWRIQVIRLK